MQAIGYGILAFIFTIIAIGQSIKKDTELTDKDYKGILVIAFLFGLAVTLITW